MLRQIGNAITQFRKWKMNPPISNFYYKLRINPCGSGSTLQVKDNNSPKKKKNSPTGESSSPITRKKLQ